MRRAAATLFAVASAGLALAGCGGGASSGGPRWSAPVAIDRTVKGHARGGLAIDLDAAGNAVAVWRHSNDAGDVFSVDAIRFDKATRTWSAPAPLETSEVDSASDADLDVDAGGNAVVVWSQMSAGEESIWSSWFDAGTKAWHGATLVEIDNTGEAQKPCVAALPGGGAVAVWYQWDGLRQSLWGKRLEGTPLAWTDRSLLETTDSADALEPDVAADPNGNALAVWTEDNGAQVTVWSSRNEPSPGTWSAPTMLSGFGAHDDTSSPAPRVVLDAAGNGLAIWSLRTADASSIWASRYRGDTGAWDFAVPLGETDDRGSASHPALALDAEGNAFATWRQHDGVSYEVWASLFVAQTGTWMSPVRLDDLGGISAVPSVAAGGDRHAVVVWQRAAADGAWASRFDRQAGTWGAPTRIDGGGGRAEPPKVAVDAAGDALAIFTQLRGPGYDLLFAGHRF